MTAFSIGLSGLTVSQRLIDLTGHNIANASTPGYHRQFALLAARTYGQPIGDGVEINRLLQARSGVIEAALLRNQGDTTDVSTRLDTLRQVETLLAPGDGSAYDLLERLFNQFEQLAADPGNTTQRRIVLSTASSLVQRLGTLAGELRGTSDSLDQQASTLIDEINRLTPQIASLNASIQQSEARGIAVNDLRDQRDSLISQLGDLIDVRTIEQDFGQVAVVAAGLPVVLGKHAIRLQLLTQGDQVQIAAEGSDAPLDVRGGKAAGLLDLRNQVLPDLRTRLDTFARQLVQGLDSVQATGLGLSGPSTFLSGTRAARDVSLPLAQAGLSFPPVAGDLYVSVTDLATNQRTLTRLAIDPATQSLQDVATALSGIANLQAIADPQTGTLKVFSAPGYGFDFAGQLPSTPSSSAITGTTTPSIAGTYSGTDNDMYSFQVVGSGTVGVTPGLTLEVRDDGGTLLASVDIGQGYEPGSTLPTINGVRVSLSAGTANDGDVFTVPVVAQANTAGVLSALGLNTLFTGDNIESFRVRPEVLADPRLLAASITGQPGDGRNLRRMAALRDEKLFAGGTQNLREFYAALVGDVGGSVQDLSLRSDALDSLRQGIEAERQSVSGVDPNEELVRLLQFQRSFQMSARFITAVNETLLELVNII